MCQSGRITTYNVKQVGFTALSVSTRAQTTCYTTLQVQYSSRKTTHFVRDVGVAGEVQIPQIIGICLTQMEEEVVVNRLAVGQIQLDQIRQGSWNVAQIHFGHLEAVTKTEKLQTLKEQETVE